MEYQKSLPLDHEDISVINPLQDQNGEFSYYCPKYSYMNLNKRLDENKERRIMIEIERQREKENILKRRKQKNDNVSRLLQAKYIKDDIQILKECRKTTSNFHGKRNIQKSQEIQQKIQQTRAKQYRTHYQQSMRKKIEQKEHRIQKKKMKMQRSQSDKCAQFHLQEWKSYEKKILEKYGGKVEKKNLYDIFLKREKQISKFVNKYKENAEQEKEKIKTERKRVNLIKKSIKKRVQVKRKEVTPIDSIIGLDSLGLSKSMKNPQEILNKLVKFIDNKKSLEEPLKDKGLVEKLQFELCQMQDSVI